MNAGDRYGRVVTGDFYIKEDDPWPRSGGELNRTGAVTGLSDDNHVALRLENPTHPLSEEGMVIDDRDANAVS
jgi:hypothetical protein